MLSGFELYPRWVPLTFIRYIEVNFTFALVGCVRYNEDFVK